MSRQTRLWIVLGLGKLIATGSFLLIVTLPLPVFAQAMGALCGSGDVCSSDLTCVDLDSDPSRTTKVCTRVCRDAGLLSSECPSPTSCNDVPGVGRFCVDLTGGAPVSGGASGLTGGSAAITCVRDSDCPGGTPCTDGTCRQDNGTNCSQAVDCRTGSGCCPSGGAGQRTCQAGVTCSAASVPTAAEAPAERPSLFPVRLGVAIGGSDTTEGFAQYVAAGYRYAVQVVIIVAIVMVVYGGFRYLFGSASGDISRGKQIIMDAIIGMLLVLGAYTILNTINPATLNLRLPDFNQVQKKTSSVPATQPAETTAPVVDRPACLATCNGDSSQPASAIQNCRHECELGRPARFF